MEESAIRAIAARLAILGHDWAWLAAELGISASRMSRLKTRKQTARLAETKLIASILQLDHPQTFGQPKDPEGTAA